MIIIYCYNVKDESVEFIVIIFKGVFVELFINIMFSIVLFIL